MNTTQRIRSCPSFKDALFAFLIIDLLLHCSISNVGADGEIANRVGWAEIKVVCRGLVGSQFPYDGLPWQRPWQRLLRYLPDRGALYRRPLVCSGHCSGSVQLQNGLWLNFTFPNPQKFAKQWGADDGLIDSVELVQGNDVVFRYQRP
jgi:hypothetical protein